MTKIQEQRCDSLCAIHMKYNGSEYIGASKINEDFNVHWTEITCDTDEVFKDKIEKLEKELYLRIDKKLHELYVKNEENIQVTLRAALLMDLYDL